VQHTIEMAITDPLTGLNNRRYLERHFAALIETSAKEEKPLSAIFLDIDHFKSINDTHGHAAGDEVLKAFARRVRQSVRGIDLVARYGGEEFVVVMPDTESEVAYRVAERLRETIAAEPFAVGGGVRVRVTVSAGISSVNSAVDTPQSVLRRCDQALYRAKGEGRNRVVHAAA
jgi:two-component system cell cycle response regulator